jgi:quercetin dioxygenase-like cupin family protein
MITRTEREAPTLNAPDPYRRRMKVLLAPLLDPQLNSLAVGLSIIRVGGKSDRAHHREGEMFYVVSGSGCICVGKEKKGVTAGTAVWVPPDVPHQLINDSGKTLKILWVLQPPGKEAAIIKAAM